MCNIWVGINIPIFFAVNFSLATCQVVPSQTWGTCGLHSIRHVFCWWSSIAPIHAAHEYKKNYIQVSITKSIEWKKKQKLKTIHTSILPNTPASSRDSLQAASSTDSSSSHPPCDNQINAMLFDECYTKLNTNYEYPIENIQMIWTMNTLGNINPWPFWELTTSTSNSSLMLPSTSSLYL